MTSEVIQSLYDYCVDVLVQQMTDSPETFSCPNTNSAEGRALAREYYRRQHMSWCPRMLYNCLFRLTCVGEVLRSRANKNYTNIRRDILKYQASLERAEKKQDPKHKQTIFHAARNNVDVWSMHRDSPSQDPVLNPVPMPVEVPVVDEFAPLTCAIRKPLPTKDNDDGRVVCKRGCLFSDGRLDLCKQVVGDRWIRNVMDALESNEGVKHFLLGNNITGPVGCRVIANFIRQHCPDIETWYLAGNMIDGDSVQVLVDAWLGEGCGPKAVWLKRNPLRVDGAHHVARLVRECKTLEVLDLCNTALTDEGAEAVFEACIDSDSMRVLYLDANGLGSRASRAFAKYLRARAARGKPSMTHVYMCMNPLMDSVIDIAEALQNTIGLRCLSLASVRMTTIGLQSLLEALLKSPLRYTLEVFDVGYYKSTADMGELPNSLKDEAATLIANTGWAFKMRALIVLDLTLTHMTYKGLEILADALCAPTKTREDSRLCRVAATQVRFKSLDDRLRAQSALERLEAADTRAILANYGCSMQEFRKTLLNRIRHTERVDHIASMYRNN